MPHPGFFTFLAKRPVCRRAKPTEFRQTIRARLSGDARLGQDPAGPAPAEGCYRKNFCEISRSISPPDWERHRERLDQSDCQSSSCAGASLETKMSVSRPDILFIM